MRLRGTYAGLGAPPVVDYLVKLGITAIELLPVHALVDDRRLAERGLRNYWGYNTIAYLRARAALRRHGERRPSSSRRWSSGCTRPASR